MKTCLAAVKMLSNGDVELCGKPAYKVYCDMAVCFDHWNELKKREKEK
jgi:hypothetical protein